MERKNKNMGGMSRVLLTIVITLFSLYFISGAGFGSSYLPEVNGETYLEVPIGSNVSYFVYPQNFENKTLVVKINVTDENNTMINHLQDYYEIPPNTSSDNFKIELIFSLGNNTNLIDKKFPVKYEILSTYKINGSSSTVTFNPVGFTKSFFVIGKLPKAIILPVVIQTPSSSGGGGGTPKVTKTTNTTPTKTILKNQTLVPEPTKNEIPATTDKPKLDELFNPNIAEPTGENNWIIIGLIAMIVIIAITFIVKRKGEM
jgi:hypothetical protein